MTPSLQHYLLLLVILLSGTTATAETLYRWVDDNGRVTFQGQPPVDKVFTREQVVSASGPAAAADANTPQVDIVLYSIKACEACDLVRQALISRGLSFSELDPEQDQAVNISLVERFGKIEVPLTMVGTVIIKGHNPDWLDAELIKAGAIPAPGKE